MKVLKEVKKGLTLIEVLISLAILGIIISPFLYMSFSTVNLEEKANEKQQALSIAQEYMEKIKSPSFKVKDLEEKTKEVKRENGKYYVKYKITPTTTEAAKEEESEKIQFKYKVQVENEISVYKIENDYSEILLGKLQTSLDNDEEGLYIEKNNDEVVFYTNPKESNTYKIKSKEEQEDLNIKIENNNNKIDLYIKSSLDGGLNIYLDSLELYNLRSSIGKVNINFNEIQEENEEATSYGNIYKVQIEVGKYDFKGNIKCLQKVSGFKRD